MPIKYDDTIKKPGMEIEYTPERIRELENCVNSERYFIENYVKIIDPDRGRTFFDLRDYQDEFLDLCQNNRFVVGMMARQAGKSVLISAHAFYYSIFNNDKFIGICSNKEKSAKNILRKIKLMYKECPLWLKPGVVEWNQLSVEFDNGTRIEVSATSEDSLRGSTCNLLILDEFAFVPKSQAESFWSSNYPTLSASKESKLIVISCVVGNTLVYTDKGIKRIDSFDTNFSNNYNVLGKDKLRSGKYFVNSGKSNTKKITTSNTSLEGSLDHKLWACKSGNYDWYKMKDLEVGDYIAMQYGMNIWGDNDELNWESTKRKHKQGLKLRFNKITPNLAYFFGLYISEGYADKYRVCISCGDDISEIFNKIGVPYSNRDGLHYMIHSLSLVELLEYVGFDINKKAPEKVIPEKLLEMSRENMVALLQGIFDGDGWSRKDNGCVGIGLTSLELLEQIRTILNNLGILTHYQVKRSNPTKKCKVSSTQHRLMMSSNESKKFYDIIGFRLERKENKKFSLPSKVNEQKCKDVIPHIKSTIMSDKEQRLSIEKKIGTHIYNRGNNGHLSRPLCLRIKNSLEENDELKNYLNDIVSENIKWQKINQIEDSENIVYDFSLPHDDNDKWCHSVIYNSIVGHQTPNGMFNKFHDIFTGAENETNTFKNIKVDWRRVPGRDENWAEQERQNLGETTFMQEQECVGGETIVNINTCTETEDITIEDLYVRLWRNEEKCIDFIRGNNDNS